MKKITSFLASATLCCAALFGSVLSANASTEEIVGTPFKISAGGGCDIPLPPGTPVTYIFNAQWAGINATPSAFTVEEYDEVVIKFAEAPSCYFNVPIKNTNVSNDVVSWNAVGDQAGTEWHIAISQDITDLSIQNVETATPKSITITETYAVKKDGTTEPIKWTFGWGVSSSVDADITFGTATLTGQWGGVNVSNDILGKEGTKVLRIYTDDETDLNGFPIQWCIKTTDNKDGWPQIGVVDAHYAECTITETLSSIYLQYTAGDGVARNLGIKALTWEYTPFPEKYEDAIAVTPDVTPYANGQYPKPITKFTINPADGKELSLTEEAFIEIKYNGQSDKTWNAEAIATATQEDGKIVLEYTTEKSGEYELTVKKGSFIINGDKYLMNDVSVSNYNVLLPSTELSVVEKSLDVEGGYIKFDEYIAFPDYAPNVTAKVIDASTEEEVCDATLSLDEEDWAKVLVSFATALEGGSYSLVISDGDVISENREGIVYHGAPIKFMIAGELVDCDLTKEMFMVWDNYDATAQPLGDGAGAYEIGVSSGLPYGNGSVLGNQFANLTGYSLLALTITDGAPRLLFNRPTMGDSGQSDYLEIKSADSPYVSIQGNVWYIDLAKITSEQGYAHLNAIKGANWAPVTITEAKLLVNVPTAISGAETQSLKNGKFLQNGQIVIVKNGKAYNVMGIQK